MASGPVVAMVWEGLNAVRHHPRRFLCPGRSQHLPWLGRCRVRSEGDSALVQAGGVGQLGLLPEGLDLRVIQTQSQRCRIHKRIIIIFACASTYTPRTWWSETNQ